MTAQPSPNTTKTAWFTDAPISLSEHPVTQFVTPDTKSETSGNITEAPLPYTTQITETRPSPVIKSFGSDEDQKGETTTISDVAQPETTVPPAEKLPVVHIHEEKYIPVDYVEEDITESSVIDQERDESPGLVKTATVPSEVLDMKTTPLFLSTTSASNLADPEASGGDIESTAVKATEDDSVEEKIITVGHKPNMEEPTMVRGLLY